MGRGFSHKDYKTLCQIVKLREQPLRKAVANIIEKFYNKKDVVVTKNFVCAWGEIPVALVAHLDTVHPLPPIEIFYDAEQSVIWSPDGIGADDRAGVFAILNLLTEGYRPTVIFTTGEEIGGVGAEAFIEAFPKPQVPIHFIIELDRCGKEDMVFYDCHNPTFNKFIGNYGFIENWGSFSDICIIAPDWEVAAVNLSIGYEDEHTKWERLYCGLMMETIDKVRNILTDAAVSCPTFQYVPGVPYIYSKYDPDEPTDTILQFCDSCEQQSNNIEYVHEGGTCWGLCPDCLRRMTARCTKCGTRFIPWNIGDTECSRCREKKHEKGR